MSIIVWPGLGVSTFRWKKTNQAVVFKSPFGSQSLESAAPLWEVDLTGIPQYWEQADKTGIFLESLNGYQNQLALWNLVRPVPKGTMRGAMTFAASAAQGATSLVIDGGSGQAGRTLLAGDLIGFGSGTTQQVVRIVQDAVADSNGIITVVVGTPLRNAFSVGDPVIWDKPKALFRQKSINEGIEYAAVIGQPWVMSLIEDWRP